MKKLEKVFDNLIKETHIDDFYSKNNDKYDDISIQLEVNFLVKSFIEMAEKFSDSYDETLKIVKLKLADAGKFMRQYLILRKDTDFSTFRLLPDSIKYFCEDEEFYFSSGQESRINLFTNINLAISNLKNVNRCTDAPLIILIDEPDNALHPSWQKNFISEFNKHLSQYKEISIHVIMTTHSPIIASDLTSNHVIFLEKYENDKKTEIRSITNDKDKPRTFAQNIYNLYKESFFIKDGMIGTFADNILIDLYKKIEGSSNESNDISNYSPEYAEYLIDQIGEPLIKMKFEETMRKWKKKYSESKDDLLDRIQSQIGNDKFKSELKQLIDKYGGSYDSNKN